MTNLLPTIVQQIVIVAFVLIWVLNERAALFAFILGIALFDRNFAYVHAVVGSLPLYLPEICLIAWIARTALAGRLAHLSLEPGNEKRFWTAWTIFIVAGTISLISGFLRYPAAAVLRDSALCYYSVIALLIAAMPLTYHDLLKPARLLVAAGAVKVAFGLLAHANVPPQLLGAFIGQPAAFAMVASLTYIALFSAAPFGRPWLLSIPAGVCLAGVLVLTVRSAWTGLIAALFVQAFLLCRRLGVRGFMRSCVRFASGSGVVAGVIIFALNASWGKFFKGHQAATVVPIHSVPDSPPAAPLIPSARPTPQTSAPDAAPDGGYTITDAAEPVPIISTDPAQHSSVPLIVESRPVVHRRPALLIGETFESFFHGVASRDVQTRLWMWHDAVAEVWSVGHYSPHFLPKDAEKYHLPTPAPNTHPRVLLVRVTGLGVPAHYSVVRFWGLEPDSASRAAHRMLKRLFGIPFGRLYLPPQVVWVVNSHFRYDPHNSFVHVLYRMGLTGFLSLLALIYFGGKIIVDRFSQRTSDTAFRIHVALVGILAYHITHSLTDNTLENAFKALWFWLALGLSVGLRPDRDDNERPPSS